MTTTTSWIDTWFAGWIDAGVQGAIVLAATAALVALMRGRASASARHLAWSLGLAALVVLPVLAAAPARWSLGGSAASEPAVEPVATSAALPPPTAPIAAREPLTAPMHELASERAPDPLEAAPLAASSTAPAPTAPPFPWRATLLALWLAGALAALLPYLLGWQRARRIVRRATPAGAAETEGVPEARAVPVLRSAEAGVPMTVGLLRPVVVLPTDFATWPAARRRDVLLHELAHARRRDGLFRLLARVAVALHWFDPLAWVAERRARRESECACDDAVLAAGSSSAEYAGHLLGVARAMRARPAPPAAAIAMASGAQLEERVRAILDAHRPRGAVGLALRWGAGAGALLVTLPLGSLAIARTLPAAQEREPAGRAITVAADGSGDFRSIQEAVDAAPENGLVRIGPGTYSERVAIEKPLTLEGAGWQETRISVPYEMGRGSGPEGQAALAELLAGVDSEAETKRVRERFFLEQGPRPTLLVRGAPGVVVRGLTLSQPGEGIEGRVLPSSIVRIEDARARVERCVVVGSPASGIQVLGASDLEVAHCLVAAVQATGIQVAGPEPVVSVADCDVRRCRHRGITVGRGNRTTTIERCRVSHSEWHGIRYDDAAPLVAGNLIFENARSGIYASGETSARVTGNLFYRNGMTGLSCWYRNEDRVEGNTFVGDRRSGVEVLGAAKPAIHRNLFHDLKVAVKLGNIGEDSPDARTTGQVDLEENLYWKVEEEVRGGLLGWIRTDAAGDLDFDPMFVAPEERDYALGPDSPARTKGIGAADPLGFESPWPLQPEEGALADERTETEQREEEMRAAQTAFQRAKPWIDDLMQIQDAAKRDAAVAALREALQSDDPIQRHAALIAFVRSLQATYDHASFRGLLRPLCASETGDAQVQAFYALNGAERRAGDEKLLLEALREPSASMRQSGSHLLMLYFDSRIEGEAARAALSLLDGIGDRDARTVLSGLWGATASDEVQQRYLELAAKPGMKHDAIYFGLSTLQNKSRPVVEYLLDVLDDADFNDAGRAMWGLGQGVAEAEHPLVAYTALKLFDARNDARTRTECLGLLTRYGDSSHVPALQAMADNELLSDGLRAQAREAIAAIEGR